MTTFVAAPIRTVAGVLRDVEVVSALLAGRHDSAVDGSPRLVSAGDEIDIRGAHVRVRAAGVGGLICTLGGSEGFSVTLAPSSSGTAVVWSAPDPARLVPDLARTAQSWSDELGRRAATLLAGPVVVATALVRNGTVLVAQRTRPPALAGRWELPGGRVEVGETEPAAVVRECREELGTAVVPGARLGTDLPIHAGVLRVHTAHLAPGAPSRGRWSTRVCGGWVRGRWPGWAGWRPTARSARSWSTC